MALNVCHIRPLSILLLSFWCYLLFFIVLADLIDYFLQKGSMNLEVKEQILFTILSPLSSSHKVGYQHNHLLFLFYSFQIDVYLLTNIFNQKIISNLIPKLSEVCIPHCFALCSTYQSTKRYYFPWTSGNNPIATNTDAPDSLLVWFF